MWGTDWTRTIGMLTYEQGVAPFRDTKRLSENDKAALLGGTLQKVYKWQRDRTHSAAPQSDGTAQEPATALLIVDLDKHIGNSRAWRDTFGEQLPDLEIRIWPDAGNLADIVG